MDFNLKQNMLPAPVEGGFRMEGYWVWCGSVVKGDDNRYHMFASRWPKHFPMHPGWLVASEIVRASSDLPEGPYKFEEVVLGRRNPAYWDGRMAHNPLIIKHKDKYVLYYTGSTHSFSEPKPYEKLTTSDMISILTCANQRIGVAVADSVFGPWQRLDNPILTIRPEHFDSFMVNNPSVIINDDDSVYMLYKSRGYKTDLSEYFIYDNMKLSVAKSGHYSIAHNSISDNPIFDSEKFDLEDPFIWRDNNGVFCMISKDMDGNTCGEPRGGACATSIDGVNWTLHTGSLAYSRNVLWSDGVVREMGNMERPFILFDEQNKPTHMFFATSDGENGLVDCKNTWNMVIPLKRD